MDVNQLKQQLDLLEERLENLQVGLLPDFKTFIKGFLICEEEIAKRVLVYKQPEITRIQADLMVGDCGEGFQRPNIYEFAGLTGSVQQLREKLKDQLEKVWGNVSNMIKQLKDEAKKIAKQFVAALRGFFREIKKLVSDMIEAFALIGSSIAAISVIIFVPPWNVAEAIVHVIQIVKALKTIILAFAKLLVYLSPLALLIFVVKKEKIKSIISTIGAAIQIILKLLLPLQIIQSFIFKILDFLKKRKPSCAKQRRRIRRRIRRMQRKRRRFDRRATRRGGKWGFPNARWKRDLFDPDPDHISRGGDQNYSIALKIIRNDRDITEDDDAEKFIDAVEGYDDSNEEIKTLEEQLANICKKEATIDTSTNPINSTFGSVEDDAFADSDIGIEDTEDGTSYSYSISRVDIYDEGSNYNASQCPVIFVNPTGFTGQSAAGFVRILSGNVKEVILTTQGSGYLTPPRAYISCGGGTQSVLIPRLSSGVPVQGAPITAATAGSSNPFVSGSGNTGSGEDFYSNLGNLAGGFDEDLIDSLIDKLLNDDLGDLGEDIQNIVNEFSTYAVKYPDGTVERGVTEDELDELKNIFKVEIRDSFED